MDPLSAILFLIVGVCLTSLWRAHANLLALFASLRTQMNRFISDIESEKETRRRSNHDLVNRIRILEGQRPLPPHDSPEG